MKLLIATPLYPPEPGGPATHTKLLETGLPGKGISVEVVKFSEVKSYPKVVRHILYFFKVFRASRGKDVLLVQDTLSCGLPAALAAGIRGLPFVVRVPGDHAWEQGSQRFGVRADIVSFQKMSVPWQVRILKTLQSWVAQRADLVIVPSKSFASVVAEWGVAPERLKAIYHGMRELKGGVAPTQPPPHPYMVSIGRLVPWKGFEFLIRLLPQLPEWRLVIVGNGPDRAMLEAAARETGVSDRVLLTGGVPHDEALGWCVSADAFVLNTGFESFSFQVLEAMALGCRTITNEVGSIPELITGGEGVLLQPDDTEAYVRALKSVREDPEAWEKRRAAGVKRAAWFSTERMLAETADNLKRLV
ncbi:MAG TPA: glycosyltransferase family 4 protein [Candidatus Paceibacterota bacterium]|jgi:glycosyltransferase involved in cell wall biosynthesis